MGDRGPRAQGGFTLVELIVAVCITAVLASVALHELRDYVRRARVSEVVLATNQCKNVISENYLILNDAPNPGHWGCESGAGGTRYAGAVQTSSDGVVRAAVANVDPLVDGHYVYLVPARPSGSAMTAPADLGDNVRSWICGSDWQPVRNALPANCRTDTTTFSSQDFN